MHLQELKKKTPSELLEFAEELEIENASILRKQDMMFAILKQLAENEVAIFGMGVLETLSDGFGFLRSPESNYLPGPDDIYVSPNQVRRFGLRTGDTVEGEIRAPKDGERYFALLKLNKINFEEPDSVRHRINFDNLTPLYPESKINFETEFDPSNKDITTRVVEMVAPMFRKDTIDLASKNNVTMYKDEYNDSHLENKHIVIATTDNPQVNLTVYEDCRKKSLLVNVADNPPLCDFYMGGIVTKGNVKIAISTNGKSPTTAKRLRQFFEDVLPDNIDDLVQNLNEYRKTIKGDFEKKVEVLNEFTKGLVKRNPQ